MPETTSSRTDPTALDALRALADAPAWHEEPLATWLAERLGCGSRAARAALAQVDVRVQPAPSAMALLDETWLYRTTAGPIPGEGVLEWTTLEGGRAIVRTLASDAVHREKVMRALHARLGERPMLQLDRARPPASKRKLSRADRALAARLAAEAWPTLSTRAERELARKLCGERLVTLAAWPRPDGAQAHHILLKLTPSSTAAATRGLAALPGAFATHVAATGEARDADAFALDDDVAAAREVPGVAAVEARRVVRRWRDEAAWDALLKDGERRAAG